MKVYVVYAFDAEPYEYGSWVHGIYDSREKAEAAIGPRYKVYDVDVCEETGQEYGGYMISDRVCEVVVQ